MLQNTDQPSLQTQWPWQFRSKCLKVILVEPSQMETSTFTVAFSHVLLHVGSISHPLTLLIIASVL